MRRRVGYANTRLFPSEKGGEINSFTQTGEFLEARCKVDGNEARVSGDILEKAVSHS